MAYYLGINIDSVHYFSLGNGKALQVMFEALFLKDIPGSHSVIFFFFFFNLLVKVFCPLSDFFFFHYFSYYYGQKLENKEYALSLLILSQDLSHRLKKCLLND